MTLSEEDLRIISKCPLNDTLDPLRAKLRDANTADDPRQEHVANLLGALAHRSRAAPSRLADSETRHIIKRELFYEIKDCTFRNVGLTTTDVVTCWLASELEMAFDQNGSGCRPGPGRHLIGLSTTRAPFGNIFPRRIVPWDDFATRQEEIWDALSTSDSFFSNTAFPSQHQMEYVKSLPRPISSEIGLRDFERHVVVENAVEKLIQAASTDVRLQRQLGIRGIVTLESHTNLGSNQDTISTSMEQMSLGGNDGPSAAASTPNSLCGA
ncbi:hypothetical protein IL306_006019 [Fusarium sp. DS 682]|nr:hypothetical protein IL306_006019 [Fusarium sp. DS 682]